MSTSVEDIGQAIVRLVQDTETLHDFVHGPDTETVETESGEVPTVNKLVKDLREEIGSITTEAVAAASAASVSADEAAVQAELSRQSAVAADQAVVGIADTVETVIEKAEAAAVSASESASSAGSSASSASSASSSKSAAEQAATAAGQSADLTANRSARFLVPAPTHPTVRDNGNPLQDGDQYQNTTDHLSYSRVGGIWAPLNQSVQQLALDMANPTDPSKGAGMVGWTRDSLTALSTVHAFLDAQMVSIWEFEHLVSTRPTPTDPGTWDWTPAVQAALAAGGSLFFPKGTYLVTAPCVANSAGQRIVGDGAFKTFLKAAPTFSGAAILIMGNKGSTAVTGAMQCRDLSISGSGVDAVGGIEAYGLRDGTTFSNLYVADIKNAPGIKTNMAGDGTGVAASKMCEGVQFTNCHVITNQSMVNTHFWQLDGLFESQLLGCKALGSSAADVTGSNGFRLGVTGEARGVALIGCSAGNLSGGGGNFGIRYGEWTRECWDQFTTFENILGSAAYFHGSNTSGTLLPFDCRSIDPRPYNNNTVGVLDPLYRYGDSNACYAGDIVYYNSNKVWARFDAPLISQTNNVIEIMAGAVPSALLTSLISFDAASATSNMVTGFSSDAAGSRKKITINKGLFTERHEGNGFVEQNDVFWTSFNAGTPNKIRYRSNTSVSLLELDGAAATVTPKVRLNVGQIWSDTNLITLGTYRLWIDSFGRTRSKNGAPSSAEDGFPLGQKVAVPATATSSGSPGVWAASSTFFYTYVGDGTTHSWVRCALATW